MRVIDRPDHLMDRFSQLWQFDNGLCMSVVDLPYCGWEIALGWINEGGEHGWDWAHDRPTWPPLAEFLSAQFPDLFYGLGGSGDCIMRISGMQEARDMAEALESLSRADLDRAFEKHRKGD